MAILLVYGLWGNETMVLEAVGLWDCGVVGLWGCGAVGLWGCGVVGLWGCGAVGVVGQWDPLSRITKRQLHLDIAQCHYSTSIPKIINC